MKKLYQIFEIAWLVAVVAAFGVGIYNLIIDATFDHRIYFPFIVGFLCIIVYLMIRNHRLFLEKQEQAG